MRSRVRILTCEELCGNYVWVKLNQKITGNSVGARFPLNKTSYLFWTRTKFSKQVPGEISLVFCLDDAYGKSKMDALIDQIATVFFKMIGRIVRSLP